MEVAIECLDKEHGEKIIQYFLSLGAKNPKKHKGNCLNCFYFIDKGIIDFTGSFKMIPKECKLIEIPVKKEKEKPKRGDEIWVSDTIDGNHEKRIFLAYIEGAKSPVVTVAKGDESNFKQGKPFSTVQWRYYKRIEEKDQIVELTMEDISNGKGVGIKPELIRIKK